MRALALLIPAEVHKDCSSSAEKRLFKRFERELSDELYRLSQSWCGQTQPKAPGRSRLCGRMPLRGVLFIEVKGGGARCSKGQWSYINRHGEEHSKAESPFQQVTSAMFTVLGQMKETFGNSAPQVSCTIGHTVIFPDVQFSVRSPEWDLARVIDGNTCWRPMDELMECQYNYSAKDIEKKHGRTPQRMTTDQTKQLGWIFQAGF